METSEITSRLQSLLNTVPAGLTGLDPMPYGYKRWNGSIWPDIQVDRYNAELTRIAARHQDGYNTQNLIDGLYNMAHGFDTAGKPAKCSCTRYDDGSTSSLMCPAHAEQDPCIATVQVTGKRRKGSITRGTCTNCGWKD